MLAALSQQWCSAALRKDDMADLHQYACKESQEIVELEMDCAKHTTTCELYTPQVAVYSMLTLWHNRVIVVQNVAVHCKVPHSNWCSQGALVLSFSAYIAQEAQDALHRATEDHAVHADHEVRPSSHFCGPSDTTCKQCASESPTPSHTSSGNLWL